MIGQSLGPYRVLAKVGEGGMGEVYRARDTTLDRDVAIKILPASFASDPDRLARFEREAKTLASLNHPHIGAVYGFEKSGGTQALVMELVEGEDLGQRIGRGAIPLDEARPIARQIAEALEAAHEQAIVHRDLKPANIKVRPDGSVKVLDFGLAKAGATGAMGATGAAGAAGGVGDTVTSPAMTVAGMILGTAAYMSPEQARGKVVDKRADIWAFGCVLYEMLTARRLFEGDTVSDTLAAVLTRSPEWSALPPTTPPSIVKLIRSCLVRDPKNRLRDIGDARLLLDELAEPGAPSAIRPASMAVWPWLIAALATIGAVIVTIPAWRQPTSRPAPAISFAIPLAEGASRASPVMSPDGAFVVYDAGRLYLRRLSEFEASELPGTAHASQPFLSPDGMWVGFYADGKLKKVRLDGGEPLVITDAAADSPGATFVSADRILFTRGWSLQPLMSVAADGGAVTPVSTLDTSANERGHWWPRALPDGRHVLFTIWYADAGLQTARVGVLDLPAGTHRALFPGAMAQYADGHVLYYHAGQYLLAPFDPARLAITGASRPVLPDALGLHPSGSSYDPVSLAATGAVAYSPGEIDPRLTLTWVDRGGRRTPTGLTFRIRGGNLSADGTQVALGRVENGSSQVWVHDFAGAEQRIRADGANFTPIWHPDGRRLAYTSLRKGNYDVVTQGLDAAEAPLLVSDLDEEVSDWLADGRFIVKEYLADGATSIRIVSADGSERTPLVTGEFPKGEARVSRDGRWLAVCAAPAGRPFLYVRSLFAERALQQLAAVDSADCDPRWVNGAQELAFVRGSSLVLLAYDERGERLTTLRETVVATMPVGARLFGVTAGGQRFLTGLPESAPPAPTIRLMVGGVAALRR